MPDTDSLLHLEFTILGSLIREPKRMGETAAALTEDDFSEALTRRIYRALLEMHFEGAPIDRQTLLHKLGDDYAEAVAEALKYHTADLGYYCGMLREKIQLSKLQTAALGLSYADTLDSANEQVDKINSLMIHRPGRKAYSMSELLGEFFDGFDQKARNDFLSWGFEKLDKHLFARLGNFIVIGGYPSAGKTLLSIQLALRMARQYRVGYYSFETDARTLAERLLAHVSHVPLAKIKAAALTDQEALALTRAAESIRKLPIDWIPCAGSTVANIRAEALNRRHQVIFIDYLQQISSRKSNRYEQVTEISQDLATLARAHGIAVIALAQLSRPERAGREQQVKRPNMSSFRESGQIEQDADIALLLYPADLNDNHSQRILSVGKNKEGERPQITLDFDGATQTFKLAKSEQYKAVTEAVAAAHGEQRQVQVTFEDLPDDGPLPF